MFKYIIIIVFLPAYVLYNVNGQGLLQCVCQPSNTCYQNLTSDGGGNIDPRIVNGPTATQSPAGTTLTPPGVTPCPVSQEQCCSGMSGCGVRWNIPITPTITPAAGQARYGSQPWQAVVLGVDNSYVGGGVLIDSVNVLTVAHKVFNRTAASIKVRMGEWDSNRAVEPYPTQEALVIQIRSHTNFNRQNFQNDIALLRLASPIQIGPRPSPAINIACLPAVNTVFDNMRCLVSGWGQNSFVGGTYQSILKEIDVPVVTNADCNTKLRITRLGTGFNLDTTSFICAGGERDRDSCVGDGGSALVCSIGSKYQIAGLVSWGIGCGSQDVPGVYVRVQSYLQWIQQNLV